MAKKTLTGTPSTSSLLDARASVPQHVVYRSFVHETVILNLETGKYHGLNPTAGQILEALVRGPNIREAAARLAAEHGWPQSELEQDVCELCVSLLDRGLIDVSPDEH
jgi:coenzyme PQQ synthesis protein D (PqqD)